MKEKTMEKVDFDRKHEPEILDQLSEFGRSLMQYWSGRWLFGAENAQLQGWGGQYFDFKGRKQ